MARRIIGVLAAVILSAGLHLLLLNVFREAGHAVLIEGGALQVEIGLDAAASPASAEGAEQTDPETDTLQKEPHPEVDPLEMEPDQEPQPVTEPEPAPDTELAPRTEQPVAPTLPVESLPEKQPEETQESEREPNPEAADAPESPEEKPDQPSDTAKTEDTPEDEAATSLPEGGAPSTPSAGSSSEGGSPAQPAAKRGNADSQNYAGQIMEHLSRVRRPRASVPGSALVAFVIAPSGDLESVRIFKSSGSAQFDRDAVRMVKKAAPFPKPPPGVNRDFVVEIEGR